MKLWCRTRELLLRPFVLSRTGTRDRLTISAINALPVVATPLRQELAREQEKGGRVAGTAAVVDGKTCPACGSNLKIKVLKYWCDAVTDIITPADTVEQCDCGWSSPITEHDRPF